MMSPRRIPALLLLLLTTGSSFVLAGWTRVPVKVTLPPKVETRAGERVLVTLVRANEHELFNVGHEITRWLRRELGRNTGLEIIDVPPPQIPEQRAEKLAVNDVFWKRMGEDFEADLIVAAIAEYTAEDRSGFVSEDYTSEITGQTVRRTVYRDRTAYKLRLHIFFLKGDNGALLHGDVWQEERTLEGQEREDLHVLFQILDVLKPDLMGVIQPTAIAEPRFIWAD